MTSSFLKGSLKLELEFTVKSKRSPSRSSSKSSKSKSTSTKITTETKTQYKEYLEDVLITEDLLENYNAQQSANIKIKKLSSKFEGDDKIVINVEFGNLNSDEQTVFKNLKSLLVGIGRSINQSADYINDDFTISNRINIKFDGKTMTAGSKKRNTSRKTRKTRRTK